MGVMNRILTGVAGTALARSALGRRLGGAGSQVLLALVPVALGMLANRQRKRVRR